ARSHVNRTDRAGPAPCSARPPVSVRPLSFSPLSFPPLALLGLAAVFSACTAETSTQPGDPTDNQTDGIPVCATGATVQGIDVSVHNGTIDWAKVKASGRVFAIARVSDGLHYPDSQFAANWKGIEAQGLVRGVYQYFRASQDPVAQADYLVSQI